MGDANEPATDSEPVAAKPEKTPAPAPEPEPVTKTVAGDANEPAPDGETAAAVPDQSPAPAPEPEPVTKTVVGDANEPATDDEAATAGEDEATAAAGELLTKPDDDISELVSGVRSPAAGVDEAPISSTAPAKKPAVDVAGPAPAIDTTDPSHDDETDVRVAAPVKKPAEDATTEVATTAEPATPGQVEAAERSKTPAFRGTDETPTPRQTLTIRELLKGTVEVGEHDVFYVHAVTPDDYQGLWGIIQKGVTENFARGVRITVGKRTDTYRVAVPRYADEVLEDRSSSPLGLMIFEKSGETIVYNRRMGRLTQDPDVTLFPGNEIIIVGFKPEELISLYKHFAGADGG